MIQTKHDRMVLRVRQKEDHLQISIYDTKSAQPDKAVWEGVSHDLEDAKHTAVLAACGYLAEYPAVSWKEQLF
jgi:hypothetical protein